MITATTKAEYSCSTCGEPERKKLVSRYLVNSKEKIVGTIWLCNSCYIKPNNVFIETQRFLDEKYLDERR